MLSSTFFQFYENDGDMPPITTSNKLNDYKGGRCLEFSLNIKETFKHKKGVFRKRGKTKLIPIKLISEHASGEIEKQLQLQEPIGIRLKIAKNKTCFYRRKCNGQIGIVKDESKIKNMNIGRYGMNKVDEKRKKSKFYLL